MRTIFLLDIDCFFASVEMALHPELRGRPLVVGGRRDDRGIVACPNYEARAYGVRTAMPLRTAARLLPPDPSAQRPASQSNTRSNLLHHGLLSSSRGTGGEVRVGWLEP